MRQLELGIDHGLAAARPGPAIISICGASVTADHSGALYWPEHDTLIVSDLHLEQGAALAARGSLLPPYDTRATLARLEAVLERFAPARLIALGDSFHSVDAATGLDAVTVARLHGFQAGREWVWVTGNHDPELPSALGGLVSPSVSLGRLKFRHEPTPGLASGEIAGHLHPAARLARRGASVRRKCFVSDGNRLVMPAFGAYTGGLSVLSPAFKPLFGERAFGAWMLGRDAVYPVARRQLLGD